jgi:predicted PurR-regulated permease PerM
MTRLLYGCAERAATERVSDIKKINIDPKYAKISLYALFVIMVAILFERTLSNINTIQMSLHNAFSFTAAVLAPFIYGAFIAFLLNPLIRLMETKALKKVNLSRKTKRMICSFLAILAFIGVIVCIVAYILPEIISSVYTVIFSLPDFAQEAQAEINSLIIRLNLQDAFTGESLDGFFEQLTVITGTVSQILTTIVSGTLGVGMVIFNFVIGCFIAFYMLIYKDGFKKYLVKIIYVLFEPNKASKIIKNTGRSVKIFEGFFVGKALDSLIVGIIFLIVAYFFIQPRYILLSTVIVGVTNMIPFFGPFIGGIPIVILALFYDFNTAVSLAIFIFVLQQFDGYVLGPYILGDSTGLSPFWVIVAVLVGAAFFGLAGMLLGVPAFAVIKMFLDEAVDRSFKEKYRSMPDSAEGSDNE